MSLCRTCGEPLRTTGSECEDCISNRRDARPARRPTPDASDPLGGQRRAVYEILIAKGVQNPITICDEVFEKLARDLPEMLKARALQAAGLAEREPRTDNTTGHQGVDRHRGKFRARVWRGGRCVWQRSSIDLDRAVAARAKYLADHP